MLLRQLPVYRLLSARWRKSGVHCDRLRGEDIDRRKLAVEVQVHLAIHLPIASEGVASALSSATRSICIGIAQYVMQTGRRNASL